MDTFSLDYEYERFMRLAADGSAIDASRQLIKVGGVLGEVNSELSDLRKNVADQLALQKLALLRDSLQDHIEELIYQGGRMVRRIRDNEDDTSAINNAQALRCFAKCIENANVRTDIIRGLENKRAFDDVLEAIDELLHELMQMPDVRQVFEDEEKKDREHRRRVEAQRQKRLEVERRENPPGLVTIKRIKADTGCHERIEITIDDHAPRTLSEGDSIQAQLLPGFHEVRASGFGLNNNLYFMVQPGTPLEIQLYFRKASILGGRIIIQKVE